MKKILKKIGDFFARLFKGVKKFEKFLAEHVDDAIEIAGKILQFANDPRLVTVLDIFLPEKLRNATEEVRAKAIALMVGAIEKLEAGQHCLALGTDLEKVQCFITELNKIPDVKKHAIVNKLASLMILLQKPDMKESQADVVVATRFFEKYKIDLATAA